ncbi:hypothetical protein [Flavobacterium sp. UMI-01]|uniref:hypothetical protein n=1 Tax=Flavobacterium sp. UMI-01 TaxID=1441053 RepID=UPI001C7D9549|nr:hypothetical protein [Flavobacterium sp. UMI-01]GIZ07480.1 hypothetical protein FUMI01_02070 [Flavobacterium sp. UMI-01]
MNHRIKTRIFKTLAIFPGSLGYSIYHFLQNIGSKKTLGDKIQSTRTTFNTIIRILNNNNISIEGCKIAELGSGWVPLLPYQFIFEGNVKSVDTYDINEHYNTKEIKKLNTFYSKDYVFEVQKKGKYELHQSVNYFPKTNICKGKIEDIDLIVSRFVLEHVPIESIKEMHQFFLSRLKKGSYILHLISPSDHRAYSDTSLSLQDFLKYSSEEWDKIQTKFDFHNRLRLPQYLELFKNDFEMVFFEHDVVKNNTVAYSKFKELSIHPDFKKYSEQELMAGSVTILLRKN